MILIDLQELVKQTLDQITQTYANTNQIIGLVKESGRITDYQLSNNTIAEKTAGCGYSKVWTNCVSIAHRRNTEFLISIPSDAVIIIPPATRPPFRLIPRDNSMTVSIH